MGKSLDAAESVARAFGLRSHAERRAVAASSSSVSAGASVAAELASADDVEAADARLAACIAEAEARSRPYFTQSPVGRWGWGMPGSPRALQG